MSTRSQPSPNNLRTAATARCRSVSAGTRAVADTSSVHTACPLLRSRRCTRVRSRVSGCQNQRNSAAYIHALAEASKLAYADRDRYIADPEFASVPLDRLLSKEYARELAQRIRRDTVIAAEGSVDVRDGNGDTIFLAVVDKDGNAVSLIQSLFASFGSGRMVPGTGIVLHNRGALFTLEASCQLTLGLAEEPEPRERQGDHRRREHEEQQLLGELQHRVVDDTPNRALPLPAKR